MWNYAGGTPTLASVNPGPPSIRYFIDTPDGLPLESIDGASGARRFYHYDENGNTMFLTDDTGAAVAEYAYGPYGEVTSSGLTADNPFTFGAANGMFQLGASGLFPMDSHVYDAITRRIVSGFSAQNGLINPALALTSGDALIRESAGTLEHELSHAFGSDHGGGAPDRREAVRREFRTTPCPPVARIPMRRPWRACPSDPPTCSAWSARTLTSSAAISSAAATYPRITC